MKIKAKIEYTIKETHPDKDCVVGGWSPEKVFNFEDTYLINPDNFTGSDHIRGYIESDMKLVAGGGYNWKHIDNVKIEMEEI